MAGSLGNINIQLQLDTVQFSQNLERSKRQAKQFAESTSTSLKSLENDVRSLVKASNLATLFWEASLGKNGAKLILQTADSYKNLSNRLKLVSDDTKQHAQAMQDVYDISLKTYQSSQSTAQVYAKLTQSAKELNLEQSEVARLTETVNKAISLSGVSAASAEAGLLQFSQALDKGRLNGQELISVMTQTPALAKAIADGLGVPVSALKELGEKGQLTTEVVMKSLQKMGGEIDRQFASTATTLDNSWTNLSTSVEKYIGETDQALGITKNLSEAINYTAKHVDVLAAALATAGTLAVFSKLSSGYNGIRQAGLNKQAKDAEIQQRRSNEQAAHAEAVALAQNTQANLANARANFETSQQQLASITTRQQAIAVEREQLAIQALATGSYAERKAIQVEMLALDTQSIALEQQKTAVIAENAVARQALSLAYRENIVAQSAANAGMVATTAQMGIFRTVTKSAIAELQIMKAALLSNPIMLAATAILTVGTALMTFKSDAEQASQKATDFANSIDNIKQNIDKLSEAKLRANLLDAETAIKQQKAEVETLTQQYKNLAEAASNPKVTIKYRDKLGNEYIQTMVRSQEAMNRANEQAIRVKAKLEDATATLNKSLEAEKLLQNQLQKVTNESGNAYKNAALKVQDWEKSLDKLNQKSHTAEQRLAVLTLKSQGNAEAAYVLAGLYDTLSVEGAEYANVLAAIASGQYASAEEASKTIDMSLEDLKKIFQAKEILKKAFKMEQFSESLTTPKGGGKPSSGIDYQKQYTDQLTEMQQRLAQLRADAQDIALFGQTSQYQEVNKLTQDIAANAEKYAHFGVEGVAKLKEMAAQIDSANQQVAISQFSFNNKEKLAEMQFELELLGKTAQEQERLQYYHQLDLEAIKLKQGMSVENIAILDEELVKLKEKYAITQQQIEIEKQRQQADPINGFKDGLKTIEADVSNVAGNISQITVNAFDGMSNALTDFITTGKADFRSFAQSILKDIAAMTVKMMLFNAIKAGAQAIGFGGFSEGGAVGFSSGGYTGDGGKYSPAGIVHRGEYVITKEATSRLGVDYLNYLNYGKRGFANGGGVGVPRVPAMNYQGNTSPKVTVKVINNGEPVQAEVRSKSEGNSMEITVELMRTIAKQEANSAIQQNFRAGGVFSR